jgi:hypothetical protein
MAADRSWCADVGRMVKQVRSSEQPAGQSPSSPEAASGPCHLQQQATAQHTGVAAHAARYNHACELHTCPTCHKRRRAHHARSHTAAAYAACNHIDHVAFGAAGAAAGAATGRTVSRPADVFWGALGTVAVAACLAWAPRLLLVIWQGGQYNAVHPDL